MDYSTQPWTRPEWTEKYQEREDLEEVVGGLAADLAQLRPEGREYWLRRLREELDLALEEAERAEETAA